MLFALLDNVIIRLFFKVVNQFVIFFSDQFVVVGVLTERTESNSFFRFKSVDAANSIHHRVDHLFSCCFSHFLVLLSFDNTIISYPAKIVKASGQKFFKKILQKGIDFRDLKCYNKQNKTTGVSI